MSGAPDVTGEEVLERFRRRGIDPKHLQDLDQATLIEAFEAAVETIREVEESRERVLRPVEKWNTDAVRWASNAEPRSSDWVPVEHWEAVLEAAREFNQGVPIHGVLRLERRSSIGLQGLLDLLNREHGKTDVENEMWGYGGYRRMNWDHHIEERTHFDPEDAQAELSREVLGLEQRDEDDVLTGIGASPGTGTGTLVWVEDFDYDADQPHKWVPEKDFPRGAVLAARNTDVHYVPLMRDASAIVTKSGGMSSHAAQVAREMQTPCVVGTRHTGLKHWAEEGRTVRVDGDEGRVELID